MDVGEARDQRLAVERLELVQGGVVDEAGNDLAHVEGRAGIAREHAVDLARIEARRLHRLAHHALTAAHMEMAYDVARNGESLLVVLGEMINHARSARMHIATAEGFSVDFLTGCRLNQGRTTKENRALLAHDHRLVAHGRDVSAPSRT